MLTFIVTSSSPGLYLGSDPQVCTEIQAGSDSMLCTSEERAGDRFLKPHLRETKGTLNLSQIVTATSKQIRQGK